MKHTLIQLRGSMGSGKTTTARSVIAQGDYVVRHLALNNRSIPYTIDTSKGWVVTGRYDQRATGGLDGVITDRTEMLKYLHALMTEIKPKVIVFEAVMYGCTYKFGYELFRACKAAGWRYIGITLAAPYELVRSNLAKRNGGKPINEGNLRSMWQRAIMSGEKLRNAGVDIYAENNMAYSPEDAYKIITKHLDRSII